MLEGVQSGDRCLYGAKHMCLPTQIDSLAHRHLPATGTGYIPTVLSPPNPRPRASTGAKSHASHDDAVVSTGLHVLGMQQGMYTTSSAIVPTVGPVPSTSTPPTR